MHTPISRSRCAYEHCCTPLPPHHMHCCGMVRGVATCCNTATSLLAAAALAAGRHWPRYSSRALAGISCGSSEYFNLVKGKPSADLLACAFLCGMASVCVCLTTVIERISTAAHVISSRSKRGLFSANLSAPGHSNIARRRHAGTLAVDSTWLCRSSAAPLMRCAMMCACREQNTMLL
jgi:hypothetical protein